MTRPGATAQHLVAWIRRQRAAISIIVALVCAVLVAGVLARQDWGAIFATVRETPSGRLVSASVLVALSFLALSGYDFLAIRLAGHRVPGIGLVLRASFVGTVMAMNFGFTVLSGSAVRAFYYGRAGIPPPGIARILAHMAVTFILGWLGLFGATLVFWPVAEHGARFGVPECAQRLLGALLLCLLLGYIGSAFARVRLRTGPLAWQFPAPQLALLQVAVSLVDACLAGWVVHHLLPAPAPAFLPFMGAFLTAVFLGMASQVPDGLGVIEVTLLHLIGAGHPPAKVLASMVLYRLLNFVAPLGIASAILLHDLVRSKRRPVHEQS